MSEDSGMGPTGTFRLEKRKKLSGSGVCMNQVLHDKCHESSRKQS